MDTMDTKLNRCPKCATGNTNPEQLSLPLKRIVAEEIQISTGDSCQTFVKFISKT